MPAIHLFDLVSKRLSTLTPVVDEARLVFTSRPYPTNVVESVALGAQLLSGVLINVAFEAPTEHLEIGGQLVGGELRSILITHALPPEPLDLSATLLAGELRTVLKTYADALPEPIDLSATLLSGLLLRVLVTYSNALPESIDLSATLLSGYLGP